jgi:hypothetical protein
VSWWDNFVDYLEDEVVPFWAGEGAEKTGTRFMQGLIPGANPEAIGGLAKTLSYQQFGKTALGQKASEAAGTLGAEYTLGKIQSPIGQAFYAPVRWTTEQAAAAQLAIVEDKNFFEARDIVQGDRPEDLPFWYQGENTISLGQTTVGLAGKIIPGQQEVDSIDWTNSDEVQGFFNHGPQQWVSGATDLVTTIAMDPIILSGVGYAKARTNLFVRPVTQKTFEKTIIQLDEAAAGRPSNWNPFIDDVMKNADNPKALYGWMKVLESSNSLDLTGALSSAAKYGREAVVDVLKVAVGDVATLEKLIAQRSQVAAQAANLQLKLDQIKSGALTLPNKNLVNVVKRGLASKKAEEEALLRTTGAMDINKLTLTPDLDVLLKDSPIYGAMFNRTTSALEAFERISGKFAAKRAETMFQSTMVDIDGIPTRVLTWLNPSGVVKEAPSGIVNIGNLGAAESFREVLAIVRRAESKTGEKYEEFLNGYTRLLTQEERGAFLATFEKQIQKDILIKKIFADKHPILKDYTLNQIRNLSRKELARLGFTKAEVNELLDSTKFTIKAIEDFVEGIITTKNRLAAKTLKDAVDENYVIYDGTGDPTIVAQYRAFLETAAQRQNITFKQLVKQLEDEAQYGTQHAPFYGFMDIDLYAQVLTENSTPLRYMLDILEDQASLGLTKTGLKDAMERVVAQYEKNPNENLSAAQIGWKGTKESYDALIHMTDTFYATIWKPATLLSLKYGVRNVLEGSQRILFAANDLAMLTGESRLNIAGDIVGNPWKSTSRVLNNAFVSAKNEIIKAKNSKISTESLGSAKAFDVRLDESIRLALGPNLSNAMVQAKNIVSFFPKDKFLQNQGRLWTSPLQRVRFKTVFKSIKDPDARQFIIHVLAEEPDLARKVLLETKNLSAFKQSLDVFGRELQVIVSEVGKRMRNPRFNSGLSTTQADLLTNYMQSLTNVSKGIDNAIESAVASNIVWEKYDSLLAGLNPILIKKNEGVYVKGNVQFSDAFDGPLGQLALKEASANKTVANTLFQSNRQLGETALSAYKTNTMIDKYSPRWAKEYTTYVNQIVRNDAVLYRILEGKLTDAQIAAFIMSPEMKGYRLTVGLSKNATQEDLTFHILQRRLQIEKDIPEIPGMASGWLKEQVVKTGMTEDIALNIPPFKRPSISGTDLIKPKGVQQLGYLWARMTETGFKYLGTLPETTLSRHPLYRSVYRAEGRRVFKLIQKQGRDPFSDASQQLIARSSHRRALKTLNETLYTIERRTDPAQFMRFMSPFYMAQQNSMRFWLGQTFRNPTVPYIGLLAWNTPNRVLNMTDFAQVVDQDGNKVDFSLPLFSNENIEIVLPKGVAKYFAGNERLSVSKSSMDFITQGTLPIPMLSVSGPLVSMPASYLMDTFDIVKRATDLGLDGDFIESKVMPYFDPYKADSLEGLLPMPAWFRSMQNALTDTPQSAARINLIFEQKMREADEAGLNLSDKQISELLKESTAEAKQSYIWESAFSFNLPFSTKLKKQEDIYRREWIRYQKKHGPIDGPIKFTQEFGEVKASYASSSLSENPGGLIATPQTLNNLKGHMYLAERLTSSPNANGFNVLGWLFNEGDSQDYSKIVNAEFYDIRINGVPVKQQNTDLGAAQRKRDETIGWRKWIPFKQVITSIAESRGIKPGTSTWDATFKPILDAEKARLGAKYPAWLQASGNFESNNGAYNFYAMRQAIYSRSKVNDNGARIWTKESYMGTIGKRNQVAQAMKEWIPFREVMANYVAASGYSITANANAPIRAALEAEAARLGAKYPAFATFYEYSLANDTLKTAQSLGLKVKN